VTGPVFYDNEGQPITGAAEADLLAALDVPWCEGCQRPRRDCTCPPAPEVRTHSVREVTAAGHVQQTELVCRGCGERWDTGAAIEVLEQEPCGTRGATP